MSELNTERKHLLLLAMWSAGVGLIGYTVLVGHQQMPQWVLAIQIVAIIAAVGNILYDLSKIRNSEVSG